MEDKHDFESLGTTLAEQVSGAEYRRVFMRNRGSVLEVCEFSRGPQTQDCYEASTHHHAVHLFEPGLEEIVTDCFATGEEQLADLMDRLDKDGVPYGYLNTSVGRYVSYRPARRTQRTPQTTGGRSKSLPLFCSVRQRGYSQVS